MRNTSVLVVSLLALLLSACSKNNCPPVVAVETPAGTINVATEVDAKLLKLLIEKQVQKNNLNSGKVNVREVGEGGY